MTNPLTAERALEIASDWLIHPEPGSSFYMCGLRQEDHESLARLVLATDLDARIETLEAWLTEHRSIRTHWMEYGKSDDCHECVAMQRQLTRLRAEREKLNSISPPTTSDGPKAQSGVGSAKHEKVRET
jgi:hypothetical protein